MGSASVDGGANTSGLEGTWDVTTVGRDPGGASQLTVTNGAIRGVIVDAAEGKHVTDFCIQQTSRIEVELNLSGDTLGGTLTRVHEWKDLSCGDKERVAITVSGHRDSKPADTVDLTGTWELEVTGNARTIVDVHGLAATAIAESAKQPSLSISVTGGILTVSGDRNFQFAARRR